jgi:hypothetical protein
MFDSLAEGIVVMLVACGVIGALIMLALVYGVPWLWSMLKPWLHVITA